MGIASRRAGNTPLCSALHIARRETHNELNQLPTSSPVLALALATTLAASPTQTVSLSAQLDVGALVGSGWYVPQTKEQMLLALDVARDGLLGAQVVRFDPVLNSTPVVGAWVMAVNARGYDQAMLITSGALQLVGLLVGLKRLFLDENGFARPTGPQLSFSPIVGGQLGVSVRLTNF